MKKKILLFVLSIVCLAALLGAVLTVNATEAPATNIAGHNLSLDDSVQIIYYVNQTAPEGAEVGVLCWFDPQESYTLANAQYKLAQNGTRIISGKEYAQYNFPYVAAKMMTQDVYAVSYVKVGEEVTYSKLDKYSVLQYCYNKKGSTSIVSGGTATLGELVTDLLNYGATAQKYFNQNTNRLANADYYQIKVVNGILDDGTEKGLYQAGETISLKATVPSGARFFHWENSAGTVIGTTTELAVSAPANAETYTAVSHILGDWIDEVPATESTEGVKGHYHCAECGKDFDENYNEIDDLTTPTLPIHYSEGLKFTSDGDGTCYVAGIGTCTDLDIVIPPTSPAGDRVTAIGKGYVDGDGYTGFYNCSEITSVDIPDSVTSIGEEVFSYCTSLTSVYITDLAKWCAISFSGYYANPLIYAHNLYLNGELVTDVVIPDGVTSIGQYAFNGCTSLTRITIPNSVTSIGNYAFCGCRSLTSVTIPGSVTSIGSSAFSHCSLTSIIIPGSVTSIGESVFLDCSSLTSITIPGSVTSIGMFAFEYCTSLTNITIPDSVTSIGSWVFSGCTSLTDVTIPDSVISIGQNVFQDCTSLTNVAFGGNSQLTSIGWYSFWNCTSLTSITIPDSVTSIGQYSFWNCTSLTNITIPGSVTSIERYAFRNCSSLTSVTIPSRVTSIGSYAFDGCSKLTSVTFANTSGWYRTSTQGASSGTNMKVTNPSTNATNLSSTYKDYYWYKK